MTDFITPPPLEPGDSVAIISPSSGLAATFPHVYEHGLERIRTVFDLEPVELPTATECDDVLSDHPERRAADIETAFTSDEISGVIATIGGNDQIRVLNHLDGELLRKHPTRFFGFSDNTNLAQFLWNHGIVSFYGGHVLTEFATPGDLSKYLESGLRSALFDETIGEIQPASTFTDEDLPWENPENLERSPEMEDNPDWSWYGSDRCVTGRTWGGSLEITYQQLATDRFVPTPTGLEGSILLLETSELLPEPSEVEMMLTAMGERGLLARFDGFLFGRIKARSHRIPRPKNERVEYRERVKETFVESITRYNPDAPIVTNVDFGHTKPIVPVPIGGKVRIEPDAGCISFD